MKITKTKLRKIISEVLDFTPTPNHIFMLIGPPSVGKSTWIRENVPDAFVISSDETVEAAAESHGFSYDDLFAGYPTPAEIESNYEHPEYGPIGDQQISWKKWAPKAFQKTNLAEKEADDEMTRLKQTSTASGKPIVIDMTNTNAGGRKRIMSQINPGPNFVKVGVVFEFAGAEEDIKYLAQTRSDLRGLEGKGAKTIPGTAYDRIMGGYQKPAEGEFDKVIYVDNRGKVKDFINYNLGRITSLTSGHG
tara:strand:- start:498 stop:1244 length:747 start_codon:yes stop_codon:yes gene_type:complete